MPPTACWRSASTTSLFTAEEIAAIADRLGRRPEAAIELGGWPALVRLALAVRPDVAIDFAQEEVLSQLTEPQQRALFALAHLGYTNADRVQRVVGEPVDLAQLALTVPLVSRTDDDRFRAHELWAAALLRVLDAQDVAALRGSSRARAAGRRRPGSRRRVGHGPRRPRRARRSGARGGQPQHGGTARRPRAALRRRCWSAAVRTRPTPGCSGRRSVMRSTTWTRRSTPSSTPRPRRSPDDGDIDGQIVALVVAAVVAYRRGDVARLVEVAARADRVPGSRDQAMLEIARRSIAAVVAEMSGDLPGALAELDAAPLTLVPPAISTAVQHLVIHNLLLSGRADDAVAVARRLLANRPDRLARYLSAIAGWMAGEPTELLALNRSTVDIPAVTSRDFFVRRTVVAAMLASTGQRDGVHELVSGSSPVADATTQRQGRRARRRRARAVRGRRPRRRGRGPADRRGRGRSRRQPDPRSAPAPLPSAGLRARSVGARPLGRGADGADP